MMEWIKQCFGLLLFVILAMVVAYFPVICDTISYSLWEWRRKRRIKRFSKELKFCTRLISIHKPSRTIKIMSVGEDYVVYKIEYSDDIELHTAKIEYLYDNYIKLNEYGRNQS